MRPFPIRFRQSPPFTRRGEATSTSTRRLIVVRRQSPDWTQPGSGFWTQAAAFEALIGRRPGTIRMLVELWDAATNLAFCAFRGEVARISKANLARLDDTQIIDFVDFRTCRFDERAIYAFTDDDDWYAPSLPAELAVADISGIGVTWRSTIYRGMIDVQATPGVCATNNYAILGSALARNRKLRGVAEQHFKLHDAVAAGAFSIDYLDLPLSVTNKHPASTVMLEIAAREGGAAGMRAAIDAAKARMRTSIDLDGTGVGWAAGEVDAMRRLISAL